MSKPHRHYFDYRGRLGLCMCGARHVLPKSNPVPPSSRAGKRVRITANNPDVKRAASLFERFTGHKAEVAGVFEVPEQPRVGVVMGECDGVLYTTVRDGKLEHYIHEFAKSDRPQLVVSPNGKQMFLLGGRFTFTERGIVDASDKSG